MTRKKLGKDLALKILQSKGYRVVDRNFRCVHGQIDLVLLEEDTLVFVEVKTSYGEDFELPEERISKKKIKKLMKIAQHFKLHHPRLAKSLRWDIVAVSFNTQGGKMTSLIHYRNISL